MNESYKKYKPLKMIDLQNRQWPTKQIEKAPIWCSVDLRDGNQALEDPMNLDEKISMFNTLVGMGFKEIEVGFPSASQTEFDILRTLIEDDYIPDDVTIQVLVQARESLIRRTFEAIKGAKNVILHFYNSISPLSRKVVFNTDLEGVTKIATDAAQLIKNLSLEVDKETNIRFEYSPENFSETDIEESVAVCSKIVDIIKPTKENKLILNLPSSIECAMPNYYADQIEYFCNHIKKRDCITVSLHPHNDRGTGVAAAELGLLAGGERIEGTLFGNGERTGNVDLVTIALNMFTKSVDPKLDFSNIKKIRRVYEKATKMEVSPRHPYAGDLVFTAFSGSHQDAINKGLAHMANTNSPYWEVPYLPMDPADVGREYEPIIRINSQSGKGGAAYIMQSEFGYNLPKAMHSEFGAEVKASCDQTGKELSPVDILELFKSEYMGINSPYTLTDYHFTHERKNSKTVVIFRGVISHNGNVYKISGRGNGPIDSFFRAIKEIGLYSYTFVSYNEQAISDGSDSLALSYIELKDQYGKHFFGADIDSDISVASIKAIVTAINRSILKHID